MPVDGPADADGGPAAAGCDPGLPVDAANWPRQWRLSWLDDAGTPTAALTVWQLGQQVAAIAGLLRKSKVALGDRMLLVYSAPGLDFDATLWGCALARAVEVVCQLHRTPGSTSTCTDPCTPFTAAGHRGAPQSFCWQPSFQTLDDFREVASQSLMLIFGYSAFLFREIFGGHYRHFTADYSIILRSPSESAGDSNNIRGLVFYSAFDGFGMILLVEIDEDQRKVESKSQPFDLPRTAPAFAYIPPNLMAAVVPSTSGNQTAAWPAKLRCILSVGGFVSVNLVVLSLREISGLLSLQHPAAVERRPALTEDICQLQWTPGSTSTCTDPCTPFAAAGHRGTPQSFCWQPSLQTLDDFREVASQSLRLIFGYSAFMFCEIFGGHFTADYNIILRSPSESAGDSNNFRGLVFYSAFDGFGMILLAEIDEDQRKVESKSQPFDLPRTAPAFAYIPPDLMAAVVPSTSGNQTAAWPVKLRCICSGGDFVLVDLVVPSLREINGLLSLQHPAAVERWPTLSEDIYTLQWTRGSTSTCTDPCTPFAAADHRGTPQSFCWQPSLQTVYGPCEVASQSLMLIFDYRNILLAEICGDQFTTKYNIILQQLLLDASAEDRRVLKRLGVRSACDGRGMILLAAIDEDQLMNECGRQPFDPPKKQHLDALQYALVTDEIIRVGAHSEHSLRDKAVELIEPIQICRLSSEQLSRQRHHDLGMRAAGSTLVLVGGLLRTHPDLKENVTLIRALCDSNVPKLIGGAIVFQKFIQLHETLDVLIGPTGGGKSSCLRTLQVAMARLPERDDVNTELRTVYTCVLNPTCITMGELYGEVNASVEWKGGLGSGPTHLAMASQATERNRGGFDGAADTLWIENMSTVLDDNTRTLDDTPRTKGAEEANDADEINHKVPHQTHIFVKMPHGTATLLVEQAASVAVVKAQLADQMTIPVHEQRLLLSGRQLCDSDILEHESTLHLMLRLFGGMDSVSTGDESDQQQAVPAWQQSIADEHPKTTDNNHFQVHMKACVTDSNWAATNSSWLAAHLRYHFSLGNSSVLGCNDDQIDIRGQLVNLAHVDSGKIDRKALPKPAGDMVEYVEPATQLERSLAGLYTRTLDLQTLVSATATFVELGGDSLSAVRLVHSIRQELGEVSCTVAVTHIFKYPTVILLAKFLTAAADSRTITAVLIPPLVPASLVVEPGNLEPSFLLSTNQEQMLVLFNLDPKSTVYNISGDYVAGTLLNEETVTQCLRALCIRHEVLRTHVVNDDRTGEAMQCVRPYSTMQLPLEVFYVNGDTKKIEKFWARQR
jgi:hypothetical protein